MIVARVCSGMIIQGAPCPEICRSDLIRGALFRRSILVEATRE